MERVLVGREVVYAACSGRDQRREHVESGGLGMAEPAGNEGGIRVGSTLLTLVEPHKGHEVAFNRWYERDHFYAGCLMGAGWSAGKRGLPPKPLKVLRGPADTEF